MAEETKQEIKTPRVYKRGNENVDLDRYILDAGKQMDFFLANSKLKDDQKKAVKSTFDKMLQGINDNTVQYIVGGGFDNTIGIRNTDSDFDASGLAAGLLGKVLRQQKAIEDPEEVKRKKAEAERKSKLGVYESRESIGNRILGEILGDTTPEGLEKRLNYFIYKDPFVNGKRGQTERLKLLTEGLANFAAAENWDNYFGEYDESDREQWLKDYNKFIQNVNISDGLQENEYLDLARLLGLNNIEALFFTGENYDASKPIAQQDGSETPIQAAKRRIGEGYDADTVYNSWLNQTHPKVDLSGLVTMDIPSSMVVYNDRMNLYNALNTLSDNDVIELFKYTVNNDDPELFREERIAGALGGIYNYDQNTILDQLNNILVNRNIFKKIGENQYHIPIIESQKDGASYIFTRNPNGSSSIKEISQHDNPFYTNQWFNEFQSGISALKQGGHLVPKFQNAGNVTYNAGSYGWIPIIYGQNGIMSDEFKNALLTINPENIQQRNDLQNSFTLNKIGGSQDVASLGKRDEVWNYQGDFHNYYGNYLNKAIENAIGSGIITRKGKTGDNSEKGYQDGYSGAMTNLRHLGANQEVNDDMLNAMNEVLKANKVYAYRGDHGMINYGLLNEDGSILGATTQTNPQINSETNPTTSETDSNNSATDHVGENSDAWDTVLEQMLGFNPNTMLDLKGQSIWEQIGPGLASDWLGLGLTLRGNRITNKQLKNWHIHPHIVPERYIPTTGAYDLKTARYADTARMISGMQRRATADQQHNDASYLEAWNKGMQNNMQGDLLDNQEIKRTSALDREARWEAQKLRAANYNDYMDKLTAREKEFGQIDASRTKLDTNSIVNALQSSLLRFDKQRNVNRAKLESAYESYVNDYATQLHNDFMEGLNQELADWLAIDGNTTDNWVDANGNSLYELRNYLNNKSLLYSRSLAASKLYPLLGMKGYENPYAGGMEMFYAPGSLGYKDMLANYDVFAQQYLNKNKS